MKTCARLPSMALLLALWPVGAAAHSGPPYPVVSGQAIGGYIVTVWTDPDTTDDGSAQGKFWVTLQPAQGRAAIDAATHVEVSIRPVDRAAPVISARGQLVKSDPATFYVGLPMDHEGPYAVHVTIAGRGALDCEVQATYDLRPSRFLMILYLMPFLVVGFLWAKLLLARRRAASSNPQTD